MKRLLSSLLILTVLACGNHSARAQDDMQAPPPPDQGGPGPDQGGPPPDQGGQYQAGPDQGGQDQGPDQGAPDQGGDPGVSYQTFYDNLNDQGTWVQTADYGYAFQPNVSDPDWAPYTDGHWVYTDLGWTWVSDEPWGWATYHYGRWANIDDVGWCWIPGYRWAPAWVSWRYGGGYCGWAPLPPSTFGGVEFGIGFGGGGFSGFRFGSDVDVSFGIGAGYYNFVGVDHMGDPNVRGVIVNRNNNFTIINRTTNITNITVNAGGRGANGFGGVRVGGPPLAEINRHAAHPIQTVRLAQANAPGRASVQGGAVSFYAPHVNARSARQGRPAAVARTLAHANINRGDSIDRPMQVTPSLRRPAASAEEIRSAKMAQSQAPASARIVTSRTPVKPAWQGGSRANAESRGATERQPGSNSQLRNQGGGNYHASTPENSEPNMRHENKRVHQDQGQETQGYNSQATPSVRSTEGAGYHTQSAPNYAPQESRTYQQPEAAPTYHSQSEATGESTHTGQQRANRPEGQSSAGEGTYRPEATRNAEGAARTDRPATTPHPQAVKPPAPKPQVPTPQAESKKEDKKQG